MTDAISQREKDRRMRYYRGRKCPECRKVVRSEVEAAKKALDLRAPGRGTLAGRRKGYRRTRAYECPHGYGWHIGRAKKKDWPSGRHDP